MAPTYGVRDVSSYFIKSLVAAAAAAYRRQPEALFSYFYIQKTHTLVNMTTRTNSRKHTKQKQNGDPKNEKEKIEKIKNRGENQAKVARRVPYSCGMTMPRKPFSRMKSHTGFGRSLSSEIW